MPVPEDPTDASGRDAVRARVRYGLTTWFRTPPRRHGEVAYSREVSFLELFYDLVYVVLIGRATHHLAAHADWAGVRDFAVVFGLIWLAWFNGTFWQELHGREDGRSRNHIFLQMGLLSLLAVFASEATGGDGRSFAVTYSILFALLTWQWFLVQRLDDRRYRPTTATYLAGMLATVALMLTSAFVDGGTRTGIWAVVVVGWVVGGLALVARDRTEGFGEGVTRSLVERIGLFTIIVLGEVVVGVVTGISDAENRGARTIATGMLALTIGMGIWWNYFDMLGRRVPHKLAGVTLAATALPDDEFPPGMARYIAPALGVAIAAILAVGAVRPGPIVFVIIVSAVLLLAWLALFVVYLALGGDPEVTEPTAGTVER